MFSSLSTKNMEFTDVSGMIRPRLQMATVLGSLLFHRASQIRGYYSLFKHPSNCRYSWWYYTYIHYDYNIMIVYYVYVYIYIYTPYIQYLHTIIIYIYITYIYRLGIYIYIYHIHTYIHIYNIMYVPTKKSSVIVVKTLKLRHFCYGPRTWRMTIAVWCPVFCKPWHQGLLWTLAQT